MSDFDSLREDIASIADSFGGYAGAVNRHADAVKVEFDKLWADNAELRDELHALANRLEALTNFVVSDPAEVAEAMVKKHGVPCSECGVPVYVDHLDPLLPSPIRNAADGTPHTCHIRAVPNA